MKVPRELTCLLDRRIAGHLTAEPATRAPPRIAVPWS
ncbi:MAG: hypothetical protein AVDCRST_MAG68-152 [uncultured Gemmatimonadetes bacterium]|uniref:Uncharacterized protein n=1 Tax=uncultured Gemmatimonadota bacterium TaxID=203437 RepID=A0A6J4K7P3_9BACT|nr:MAG: hypothetical protein AVDCRST_MAG68-152 [uncultured Gemmatimonadota bacterium]